MPDFSKDSLSLGEASCNKSRVKAWLTLNVASSCFPFNVSSISMVPSVFGFNERLIFHSPLLI